MFKDIEDKLREHDDEYNSIRQTLDSKLQNAHVVEQGANITGYIHRHFGKGLAVLAAIGVLYAFSGSNELVSIRHNTVVESQYRQKSVKEKSYVKKKSTLKTKPVVKKDYVVQKESVKNIKKVPNGHYIGDIHVLDIIDDGVETISEVAKKYFTHVPVEPETEKKILEQKLQLSNQYVIDYVEKMENQYNAKLQRTVRLLNHTNSDFEHNLAVSQLDILKRDMKKFMGSDMYKRYRRLK